MKKVLLFVSLLALSGCATILNEDLQNVNVSSTAEVIKGNVDGVPFTGPGIIAVKRSKADKVVNITTEGCQQQVLLASSVDPKFFINILTGGTFGSTTDYASEKMWKYQDQVIVPCK
ncbi:MAG: hypothetical protein M9899_11200 [Bdellovibrionaceae bacterium]|nr:hypothetical protein [Pseudobdellovibrionaceae bacterium]